MRFYVTIKRWSHLMLPSNKQISQSLAGKFEITLKRGFGGGERVVVVVVERKEGRGRGRRGGKGGGGGLHPQACSTEE